jgi:hypothetical protein
VGQWCLDLAGRRPRRRQRLGHRVAVAVHHRDQGVGGAPVVGEAGIAQHHGGTHPLEYSAFEGGPGRGGPQIAPGGRLRIRGPAVVQDGVGGLPDRLPAGAPAQVGQQGLVDAVVGDRAVQRGEAHHDARGAESALAAAAGHQGPGPRLAVGVGQALEGRDLPAVEPSDRGHARHTGGAVDPDGAAAALALGAAAVLQRMEGQVLAQDLEEGGAVVGNLDVGAVDAESDQWIRTSVDQLKEEPQPHVREALGFVTWNPAPCRPSL